MRPLLKIMRREYRMFRTSRPLIALAVCMPVLFVAAVGLMYSHRKVTNVLVTIVDQDHSALSREIIRGILAGETFTLGQYADSAAACPVLAEKNLSHICFVFPKYLERDVKSGRTARVAVLGDATNMLAANVGMTAASEVLRTYSVGIAIHKTEARALAPAPWALHTVQPLVVRQRDWFNPALNSNYVNFMVLGLSLVPIQLAPLLVVCRAGAREFERPFAGEIATISRNPLVIAAGKCLPYVSLMWPVCLIAIHLPHWWFGVPMIGSEWRLGLATLCFITMLTLVGFALSTLTRDEVFSSELGALLTLPNFLLSGFTWPNFAMHAAIRPLSYAFPMYHFGFVVRKIVLMGAGWKDCTSEIGIWLVWVTVAILLATLSARAFGRAPSPAGARS